ncbi:MAG: trypsin-like peptidase domain-containing protein [Candidatus Obscuribacter sp.]|nr:trypsin-like peptidase domain-containing protein [Candidatus Obscuribacter sp.]MBP6347963.1 trypsin-like peptidase domain-containing protein [Candidatus Obscuribacter sp.]MBP6591416.1 trypsin-like peptidase domain-containing protein [Candidatus Obscuribacter sp.]MBP7575158.1 trypsin-like peptidase domain-containing protein [Candidatus Obscuribacter sp.]
MAEVQDNSTGRSRPADEVTLERQVADKARDLGGRECQPQPGNKQLMVLEAGQMDIGCSYKDFGKDSGNNIDVLSLYKEMRPSTVHFELNSKGNKLGGGTGVMVKKEADSCKIMTDNHVVSDDTMRKYGIDDIKVVTEDGTKYDAKMYRANPAKDLAVIEIQTGKDTNKICKPAEAVDQEHKLKPDDAIVTFGQPYGTGTFYTSEGTARGQTTRGRAVRELRADPLPPGDDPNRVMDILTTRATPGYSGAPVYALDNTAAKDTDNTANGNSDAEGNRATSSDKAAAAKGNDTPARDTRRFIGLVDMADERATGLMTPVTQKDIKDLTD